MEVSQPLPGTKLCCPFGAVLQAVRTCVLQDLSWSCRFHRRGTTCSNRKSTLSGIRPHLKRNDPSSLSIASYFYSRAFLSTAVDLDTAFPPPAVFFSSGSREALYSSKCPSSAIMETFQTSLPDSLSHLLSSPLSHLLLSPHDLPLANHSLDELEPMIGPYLLRWYLPRLSRS